MKIILILFMSLMPFVLSSCASLSEDECKAGDWFEYGRRDGAKGKTMEQYSGHLKACSEFNITPDKTAYQKGRTEGLVTYCTKDSGLREGRAGRTYHNVCRGKEQDLFKKWYGIGKKLYNLDREKRNLSITNEDNYKKLQDGQISEYDRGRLQAEVRNNEKELRQLDRQILKMEIKYGLATEDLP